MTQKEISDSKSAHKPGPHKIRWPKLIKPGSEITPFDYPIHKPCSSFLFMIEGDKIIKVNFLEAVTWSPDEGFVKYENRKSAVVGKYDIVQSTPCETTIALFLSALEKEARSNPEIAEYIGKYPTVFNVEG